MILNTQNLSFRKDKNKHIHPIYTIKAIFVFWQQLKEVEQKFNYVLPDIEQEYKRKQETEVDQLELIQLTTELVEIVNVKKFK